MEIQEPPTKKWTEMGIHEKCKHLLKNITIEPVIAMYIVLMNAIGVVSLQFKLEKACLVNEQYSETDCSDILAGINTNDTMVNNIQKTVSQMSSWVDPIQSILTFILLLFIGSWSDRNNRRKPCLILPLSGECAAMVGLLICTYFFMSLPVEVNGLIQGILPSITGGINCIQIAIFSYITDITTEDERTFRISVIATLMSIFQPIGAYLSAVVYNNGKYYGTFGICAISYFVTVLYGLFALKEPRTPKPMSENFCKDFFDFTHILDTVKIVFKKREGNARLKIMLVVLLSVLLTIPLVGEGKLGQLFLMKQLNWDINKFSNYATFYYSVTIVGSFIVLGLLGSNLKVNDCILGIVACVIKSIVNILYAFSKEGNTFYILAIFEILSTVSITVMRSITTKIVAADELGKLYAFCGIAAAGSTIIVPTVYDLVYFFTVSKLPGAFFLIGSAINVLALLNFLYIYILQNRDSKAELNVNATALDNKGFDDIDLGNEVNSDIQTKL